MEGYPLYIEGSEAGRLEWERQGLYTVFKAFVPGAEGLKRLWLHGEKGSAYLGLMQPAEGGLSFCRRMSKRELAALPEKPLRASDCREEPPEGEGPPSAEEEEGLLWCRRPDGSLIAWEGGAWLLALPADLREKREGMRTRRIEGREYLIFRY